MGNKAIVRALIGLAALTTFSILGCSTAEAAYSVSGTVTSGSIGIAGKHAYLKLVASGGKYDDAPLFWAKSTGFSGGSAAFEIADVDKGSYSGFVFIDATGKVDPSDFTTMIPRPGDPYIEQAFPVTVDSDTTWNVADGAWWWVW